MSTPDEALVTVTWWRLLLERLGRQAAQTAVPILATVAAATGQVDVVTAVTALGGALLVTVMKAALLEIAAVPAASPGSALWVQLIDRAAPAAAGVVVGFVPVSVRDLMTVDWASVGWAALAAAVTSILAVYVTPPALTRARVDLAA